MNIADPSYFWGNQSEMQKVADAADISVLFFWAILGHFLVLLFVAKYCSVLFKSLFATLLRILRTN